MATSDDSRLLSLPMELLTRITDRLNNESLSTLRLACKTLEGTTFDRFTKTFMVSYCCIYYEARWLSLKKFLHGSPRLVASLKCIDFTTNPLERCDHNQMQLAPGQRFSDMKEAQEQFDITVAIDEEVFEPLGADRQASTALIHGVLLDLSELAPHVSIGFDLASTRFFRDDGIALHHDMFLAIASTSCCIGELVLTRRCLDDIEDLTAHLGRQLLSCTSSIHSFCFQSTDYPDEELGDPLCETKLDFLVSILRSADCLISLVLELDEYRNLDDQGTITNMLLFANNLTNLDRLSLSEMVVSEKQLSKVIATCSKNLNHLYLGGLQLVECDHGWVTMFRLLTTMPKLASIALSRLTTGDAIHVLTASKLDFRNIGHGHRFTNTHVMLRTRQEVVAGLLELLNGPLLFTGNASVSATRGTSSVVLTLPSMYNLQDDVVQNDRSGI
jgi:hypothetical protein